MKTLFDRREYIVDVNATSMCLDVFIYCDQMPATLYPMDNIWIRWISALPFYQKNQTIAQKQSWKPSKSSHHERRCFIFSKSLVRAL